MIGVAIPAHNEEACLGACLQAVLRAATHPQLAGEPVMVCVVLDACDDGSAAIVREWQTAFALAGCRLDTLEIAARQVGSARAAGAQHLIAAEARWLAFTDADTRVSPQWLAVQVTLGADVVCGSVAVDDWSPHATRRNRCASISPAPTMTGKITVTFTGRTWACARWPIKRPGVLRQWPVMKMCYWYGHWNCRAPASPGARCRACLPAPGWMRGRAVASGIRCWP